MTAAAILAAALLLAAAPAQAQIPPIWQSRPGVPDFDPSRYVADQHRYEMDRLRLQADQREVFARQQEAETRSRGLRLLTALQPPLAEPPLNRAVGSPEEERAFRRSAEDRRRVTAESVGQIDAWLGRRPD